MTYSIAYAVNQNYWIPSYVSMYSLLDHHPEQDFDFYIISKEKNQSIFHHTSDLPADDSSYSVEHVPIPSQIWENLPSFEAEKDRMSEFVNIKLHIPDLIPDSEILFLDADTLIVGDIRNLLEKDISNCILAAAPGYKNMIADLDVPLTKRRFGGGVLYINSNKWKENNVTERCYEVINKKNLRLTEESALNEVIHKLNMYRLISPKYDVTEAWAMGEKKEKENQIEDVRIIHYGGSVKPWHYRSNGIFDDIWMNYYKRTPFTNFYPVYRRGRYFEYLISILDQFPRLKSFFRCLYNPG